MQFKTLAILALASAVSADNTVTIQSMDGTDRTLVWTGSSTIADTSVPAGESVDVTVPDGWIGNFYSYSAGATNTPGMLAEFAFNSYGGSTYFDVSAIVNPDDTEGVYQIYPADTESPVSGCQTFACDNAYYLPDDVQTRASTSTSYVVTLGAGPLAVSKVKARDGEDQMFPREAVIDPNFKPAVKKGRFTSALRWANRM
ncbi:hypothetical protein M406DRAFT_354528 [Cryphonectria parasitica EP155]|uniref:Uncharacterized protein n=1 Tax=Cryphonectria parasitica (strain ATCC 38755 / EP155) TaxID=660469 RepID=A0A9P4YCQ6_CRYP1|nr:uncharacterized protein M406DRAFT_354528 [Cryphonectria parasitica EP155]KAF3770678.1 hypothetical protein M406DRAFT_354528 [Cryphonectria parasitica EP155]